MRACKLVQTDEEIEMSEEEILSPAFLGEGVERMERELRGRSIAERGRK